MRQVRIQHDGGVRSLPHVTDLETGQELDVAQVQINLAADILPTATVALALPVVDVTVDADFTALCPCCGQRLPAKLVIEKIAALYQEKEADV